jgi:WD40 repeat protein
LLIYRGHQKGRLDDVLTLAWSPDGTHIASGGVGKTVQEWNAKDGSLLLTYHGHDSWITSVAWSPDSTRIASGGLDKTVQVWNAASGQILLTYRSHGQEVDCLAWSPDSTRIASGEGRRGNGSIGYVWDAMTGKRVLAISGEQGIHSVTWSPDGPALILDAATGRQLFAFGYSGELDAVAWSPDGTLLAAGDEIGGALHLWIVPKGAT